MRRISTAMMTVLCGITLAALPFTVGPEGLGSDQAFAAKGGNGGGNGNGGNKGGGGKSSGNSGAKGKSASAAGQTKASAGKADKKAAKASAKRQQVAALAKEEKVAKEQNLNAKLGRLNSLKRNINAYINSKSAKFAGIQAFVEASALSEIAQAAADKAAAAVAEEQAKLDALNHELEALSQVTEPTTDEQARLNALPGLIDAQEEAVADAQIAADEAQAEAEATPAPDDAALETALNEMANKPVDEDVIAWAKGVLGVGEDIGKIDEMRERLEATAAEDPTADPETETPAADEPADTLVPAGPIP